MADTDKQDFPHLGVGLLSGIEEESLRFYVLLLEILLFSMAEGISWILFILILVLYFFRAFRHECSEIIKKTSLYFLPKMENEEVKENNSVPDHIEEPEAERKLLHVDPYSCPRVCVVPDAESVGWINDVIEKVWKICLLPRLTSELANGLIQDLAVHLEEEDANKADLLRQITVVRMNLGSCPLQISRIEPHVKQRDELKLDVTIEYPGNAELAVKWNNPELYAIGKNLGFSISFQVALSPIHRDLSILGGLSISLLEQPVIMLQGAGLMYLPVELAKMIINIVKKNILSWLVLDPRSVTVSLTDDLIHFPQLGQPEGMLRILLVEGRDLVAADRSILGTCGIKKKGTSDPFCKLVVDRVSIRSNIVEKTTNPVWSFYAEFAILDTSEQELVLEVYDYDVGGESEHLGETSVALASLDMKGRVSDAWLDVTTKNAPSGHIRVRLQWVPCQTNDINGSLPCKQLGAESCSKAILAVHVKSVQSNSKIEPMICLQISGKSLHTTTKGNCGQEYDFEEEIMLLVEDPQTDWFRLALFDLNKEAFNAGRILKKGLSFFHSEKHDVLSSDLVAHKGKDILSMPLVGDICFPVRTFMNEREMRSRLSPKKDMEAWVNFTAKLWLLEDPTESNFRVK